MCKYFQTSVAIVVGTTYIWGSSIFTFETPLPHSKMVSALWSLLRITAFVERSGGSCGQEGLCAVPSSMPIRSLSGSGCLSDNYSWPS